MGYGKMRPLLSHKLLDRFFFLTYAEGDDKNVLLHPIKSFNINCWQNKFTEMCFFHTFARQGTQAHQNLTQDVAKNVLSCSI